MVQRASRGAVVSAVFLVVGLVSLGSSPAFAASVQRIRSASGDDYTRVVIDLSESVQFKKGFVAANKSLGRPLRFFVDLVGVTAGHKINTSVVKPDSRVSGVRAGQFNSRTARIVIDLTSPVSTKVFMLKSPSRLVIDLTGKGAVSGTPKRATAPKTAPSKIKKVVSRTPRPPAKAIEKVRSSTLPSKPSTIVAAKRKPPSPLLPPARRPRIVLDPGHGGRDPGTHSPAGITEKVVALDVSKRVAEKLRKRLDADVVMTRTTDKYLSLDRRKDLANRLEADLFISIHANASKNARLHGVETYYLKNTDDRATRRLASLENGVDLLIKGGASADTDLSYIVSDLVQTGKEADSILLANSIQTELVKHLKLKYSAIGSLGVKRGPFLVLDGTYMPCVLIEMGFLTHSTEGTRLASTVYREAAAEGIFRGIKRYLADERVASLR
ncbi:MAG: N-acetylmuramoyl-L-alanine amidase [Candidatus Binatia bacterium]